MLKSELWGVFSKVYRTFFSLFSFSLFCPLLSQVYVNCENRRPCGLLATFRNSSRLAQPLRKRNVSSTPLFGEVTLLTSSGLTI